MRRELKSALLLGLAFALVLEVMLVPAILFWPEFALLLEEGGHFAQMIAGVSPVMNDIVTAVAGGIAADQGPQAYICMQHFFKGCSTLGIAAAVLFAVNAIAGEAQRGSLEMMLARPITRRRLLLERWALGAIAVSLPVLLTTATIPPLVATIDEQIELWPLLLCAIHESLLLLSIFSIAFLASTLGQRPVRIAVVLLFFFTLQFALYFVEGVTYWSVFRLADLFDFQTIFNTGGLNWGHMAVFATVIGGCVYASLQAFQRRVP